MSKNWNISLQKALEGSLSTQEEAQFQAEMEQNPQLRKEWEELQAMQQLLGSQEMRLPPFLATRVQHRLNKGRNGQPALGRAFRNLALPVLAAVIALLAITFSQEQALTLEVISGTADLQVTEAIAFEWSEF